MLKQYSINVCGVVQGVGFRPFVYRLATEMGIKGFVLNYNAGVLITIQSDRDIFNMFFERLKRENPVTSIITSAAVKEDVLSDMFTKFEIADSFGHDEQITGISPDIAVCDKCLQDMEPSGCREQYAFVNCTDCGPRFSIIKALPYDRKVTTMSNFALCQDCAAVYSDVESRRFHAQPVCCDVCGPHYKSFYNETETESYREILRQIKYSFESGGVIAIKGIGGYNLICNPFNADAVEFIRHLKSRRRKPFAIMFKDINSLKRYAVVSPEQEASLLSWRRPIALLKMIYSKWRGINDGYSEVGAILPYMPIHYSIFKAIDADCMVFTSANTDGNTIISDNYKALEMFSCRDILVISHDRDIYNRVDDSVVSFVNGRERIIRRSRGYVPEILNISRQCNGILALGAEINSSFAIGKGDNIILSQYIGDTKNYSVQEFYKESLEHFYSIFKFLPKFVVCDNHPNYFTSMLARKISKRKKIKLLRVNHHHAHTAAVMAEYGLKESVLSLALDGIGLGDDGSLWGGELLMCSPVKYDRLMHLPSVPMPGGDKASLYPWRMAVAYLNAVYGRSRIYPKDFLKRIGRDNIYFIEKMMHIGINSPNSSGAGRLFDAVSSLIGLCDENTYQGEAAVILEQIAKHGESRRYPIRKRNPLDLKLMFDGILHDINHNIDPGVISAVFHNTFAYMLKSAVMLKVKETGINKLVLCGGVFQNKILSELLIKWMEDRGVKVFYPSKFPCNDGGLAVGQLYIASNLLSDTYART